MAKKAEAKTSFGMYGKKLRAKDTVRKARAVGLDLHLAERAHLGTSHVPEKRAIGVLNDIRATIAGCYEKAQKAGQVARPKGRNEGGAFAVPQEPIR